MKYEKIGDALTAAEAMIGAKKSALADVTDIQRGNPLWRDDKVCQWYLFDTSDDATSRGVFVFVDEDERFTLEEEDNG